MHFEGPDLSQMLGEMLRRRTTSAKELANLAGCDPRAAENYRAGRHLPPLPVFARMVGALGADLADAVLNPSAAHARLTAEIAAHEAAAAEARRLRDALAVSAARLDALSPEDRGVQSR